MKYLNLRPIVIAGGGYAGVLAANRLAGALPEARVVLVTPGDALVDRIRLHEACAQGRRVRRKLSKLLHSRVEPLDGRLVSVEPGQKRLSIERERNFHQASDPNGANGTHRESFQYESLILALGSRLTIPSWGESPHAAALADEARAHALYERLCTLGGGTVTIIGGGLTAVELASEIAEAYPHLDVQLLAESLLSGLDDVARRQVREALEELGVQLRLGVHVVGLQSETVLLRDGSRRVSDVSVVATGFESQAALDGLFPADTAVEQTTDGRIVVDQCLRVSGAENIFAVGDCSAPPKSCIGSGLHTARMACATAMPQAAHAADQIIRSHRGQPQSPYHFSYFLQCISLGRRRGVVVFVDQDDVPTGRIWTGRRAAMVKELIGRFVLGAPRLERLFPGIYTWPGRSHRFAMSQTQLPRRIEGPSSSIASLKRRTNKQQGFQRHSAGDKVKLSTLVRDP